MAEEYPQILTTPTVIPEKVYDRYWITNFSVDSRDPHKPTKVSVTMRKGTKDKGVWELSKIQRKWAIDDLFLECSKDLELAQIVGALIDKLGRINAAMEYLEEHPPVEDPPVEPPVEPPFEPIEPPL